MRMIQELTSLVTNMHGNTQPHHISQPNETPKKTSGNKIDSMDVDKESNKRKDPQIQRPVHRKTRATANIE